MNSSAKSKTEIKSYYLCGPNATPTSLNLGSKQLTLWGRPPTPSSTMSWSMMA